MDIIKNTQLYNSQLLFDCFRNRSPSSTRYKTNKWPTLWAGRGISPSKWDRQQICSYK